MYFGYLPLVLAVIGLFTCSGFLALLLLASFRFRRHKVPQDFAESFPSVTLLKPLCGLEPNLEANLRSFFDQDYIGNFEIIFGMRSSEDPALAVVDAVRQEFPWVPVKIVFSGQPTRANAKVCSLTRMYAATKYDYLIISDSDVLVKPNYLREVVAPLLKPEVGMVTCLYRGLSTGGFWSHIEALGMSVEMTAGVLVADLLEGMKFALGPTMAIRRDLLDALGGFEPLADYCSDDYLLGQRAAELGKKVVLSRYVIDHVVIHRSLRSSLLHQVRWMKSTRFSRPAGHVASVLSFAMPFGILGLAGGIALDRPWLGAAFFAFAFANRVLMSLAAGWAVVDDRKALTSCWLYPLRDLMGFAFWACSFFGSTILWRGDRYRLEADGLMVPVFAEAGDVVQVAAYGRTFSGTEIEPSLVAER
jgi:ceramide glucosyltransferase